MNLVEADVHDGEIHFGGHRIPLPAAPTSGRARARRHPADGLRAHGAADPALPAAAVRTDIVEDLGSESHLIFRLDAPRVDAEAVRAAARTRATTKRGCSPTTSARSSLLGSAPSIPFSPDRRSQLAVDARRMHFFEPATGEVLGNDRAAPSEP